MADYVYRGSIFDAHLPLPDEPKPTRLRAYPKLANPAKCGTLGGYSKHRREGIPMCQACRDAAREYDRERKRKKVA